MKTESSGNVARHGLVSTLLALLAFGVVDHASRTRADSDVELRVGPMRRSRDDPRSTFEADVFRRRELVGRAFFESDSRTRTEDFGALSIPLTREVAEVLATAARSPECRANNRPGGRWITKWYVGRDYASSAQPHLFFVSAYVVGGSSAIRRWLRTQASEYPPWPPCGGFMGSDIVETPFVELLLDLDPANLIVN
jgi:hypothetical protein